MPLLIIICDITVYLGNYEIINSNLERMFGNGYENAQQMEIVS